MGGALAVSVLVLKLRIFQTNLSRFNWTLEYKYRVSKYLFSELVDSISQHPKNIRHKSEVIKCDKGCCD